MEGFTLNLKRIAITATITGALGGPVGIGTGLAQAKPHPGPPIPPIPVVPGDVVQEAWLPGDPPGHNPWGPPGQVKKWDVLPGSGAWHGDRQPVRRSPSGALGRALALWASCVVASRERSRGYTTAARCVEPRACGLGRLVGLAESVHPLPAVVNHPGRSGRHAEDGSAGTPPAEGRGPLPMGHSQKCRAAVEMQATCLCGTATPRAME